MSGEFQKMAKKQIRNNRKWDSYPHWHCGEDKTSEWQTAVKTSFGYDLCRSMKNKPFLLMESTPSTTNGFPVCKLKRPRAHMLSAMQAIASGSDSVQYFQWRKSRGACEKFHGAVIGHNGSENTRVFRDVCEVGQTDSLCDGESNSFTYKDNKYTASLYCDLAHLNGAEVLAEYEQDFYKGFPLVTKNSMETPDTHKEVPGVCVYLLCFYCN